MSQPGLVQDHALSMFTRIINESSSGDACQRQGRVQFPTWAQGKKMLGQSQLQNALLKVCHKMPLGEKEFSMPNSFQPPLSVLEGLLLLCKTPTTLSSHQMSSNGTPTLFLETGFLAYSRVLLFFLNLLLECKFFHIKITLGRDISATFFSLL